MTAGGSTTTIAAEGTEIEEGTALTFTATPNSGYTFANWTVLSGTSTTTETNNPYSITSLAAATTVTANWTKQETSGKIYDYASSVGTTTIGSGLSETDKVIKIATSFKANDATKCVAIAPVSGGFKAGDKVSITLYSSKSSTLNVYDDLSGNDIYSATAGTTSTTVTFTLDEDANVLYLARTSGSTTYISAITVERSGSDTQALTASLSERTKTVIVGSAEQTFELPTLTVKAGDETTTDYTVTYSSDNENVAKVSDSKLVVGTTTGIAHITYTITPKAAENALTTTYTATTVTYTVTVKEKSPLSLSVSDISINSIDATATQPTIRVYDDNNNRLTLGTDYTLSCTIKGSGNVTFDSSTNTFSVKKNSSDNTKFAVGSDTITVTATPAGDYANYYSAATDVFAYNVVEGKLATNFHSAFSQLSIKVAAGSSATTTVPVVYNGTDISDYFTYTYSIVGSEAKSTISTKGKYITFTGNASDTQVQVKVSAKPTTAYEDLYTAPADLTFTVNVSSSYTVATVSTDPTSVSLYAGESIELPDVTVKSSDKTLTEDTDYTLTWVSFSPNVASVSNGQIHALSEGTAVLHVVVSGENVQSVTDTVVVDVDDPAIFRISASNASNVTQNNSLWNSAHTMRVTLGGWLFPNKVTITSGATNESLGDGEWSNASKVTKSGEVVNGFDYYAGGTKNKNARQENGSNAQPNSTNAYDGKKKLLGNVVIRDPMFNVPCSGSYLVVQTKSIGTANVIVYQNGVFDQSGSSIQYRPQRRVFVLDEAGNAISSTARLANTTGKPGGGTNLTKYKWDWADDAVPTADSVKVHFNLSSFDMSSFSNGVYANGLNYEMSGNENLKGKTREEIYAMDAGLRGWSVLADAPVVYTFDTKPGKTYYIYNYGSKIGLYGFSFEEKTATVDNVSYQQDVNSQTITKTEEGHVATVSLDRTFKGGVWNAAVLPFSLNKQQIDAIFGTTFSKGNEDGTDILYFDRVSNDSVYFVRHAYNNIVAGKPFLIKPKNSGDITINTADVELFPYVTIEADSEPEKWCEGNGWAWVSSYANQTIKNGDHYIGATSGNLIGRTAGDLTAKGFRGFLQAQTPQASQAKLFVASNTSFVEDDDAPTAIIRLEMDSDGNFVERPATGKVYSINGQLVSNDAADFGTLPSGIYIINGKKYVK